MYEGIGRWKRSLVDFLGRIRRNRVMFARWLFEKLLGSFLISVFVLYGSFLGFQLQQYSFQSIYLAVTILSVAAYVLSVFLIPHSRGELELREKREKAGDRSLG